MAKADKTKLLEFLASLSEEDRGVLEEAWKEKFGKPLSADADVLETIRTLQKEFADFRKKMEGAPPPAPPKPGDPKKRSILEDLTALFSHS